MDILTQLYRAWRVASRRLETTSSKILWNSTRPGIHPWDIHIYIYIYMDTHARACVHTRCAGNNLAVCQNSSAYKARIRGNTS